LLARYRKIEHPLGALIDLPKLVPAFSSKGFPFLETYKAKTGIKGKRTLRSKLGKKKKAVEKPQISETTLALESVGTFIKDSILLSAYDIHHRHFRRPGRFYEGKELIFIDSGAYELSPDYDRTEPIHWSGNAKPFTGKDYLEVLNSLPQDLPFAISNYDWDDRGKPLSQQIIQAQRLFNKFPHFAKNFIVKPVGKQRHVDVNDLIHQVKKCRAFDILGITEKELGEDLIEKLGNLAKLRLAMDREGVAIPIHVWGGLDPVLTPLYFFAGAEIFDGISWLRYAYIDGVAVCRDSYNILVEGIECPLDHSRGLALHHNLKFLRELATSFRDFVLHKGTKLDMFGSRSAEVERAYRVLVTRIPEVEGGGE